MKLFKNLLVSLVVFSFVFSPYFTLAETLDTTLTPGDRSPQVSTLQKILNSIGQKVTEIGKETTYYGSLTAGAIKALQCKYNIVCSGTPETTGFGRVGPKTLSLLNSLKDTFNVNPITQLGAGIASSDGLLFSYSFDGNATDSKGGNNGTTSGSPTYTTGKIGQAISFDGVDDYVETDKTKSAQLNGLNSMTLSYWVKPTTTTGHPIVRWGTNRQLDQSFLSNKIRMYWRVGGTGSGGTGIDHISTRDISLGAWTHVTLVYNNPTSKIYINGVLDSSKDGSGGKLNDAVADTLSFGRMTSAANGGYFKGEVDDVYVYNRALSDTEIANIYLLGGDPINTSPTAPTNPATPTTPSPPTPPTTPTTPSAATVGASSYYVSPSGLDTNAGTESSPLKTIKKAADLARAGSTIYVLPGTYAEHVKTTNGGTSESSRITFKAQGKVTMQGFEIIHPYITVEGFDITGYTQGYDAHIRVTADVPWATGKLASKGDNCKLINNTIRDGAALVGGIFISEKDNHSPNNCELRGNRLSSLRYVFLSTSGNNHRFEENIFEWLNSRDYMIVFGGNHVFKRNIFWKGNTISSTGNHPDWLQFYNNNGDESYGHIFEENYLEGFDPGVQLGQINSGGGVSNPVYNPNIRDVTFRRNIFANIGHNFNISVPGVTFDHNTFYRSSYGHIGLAFGGNLTRGESSRALITNNAFVAGGDPARNDVGFYSLGSAAYLPEAIVAHVLKNNSSASLKLAEEIHVDMRNRGYINSNGNLLPAGKAVASISDFVTSDLYAPYKTLIYENLKKAQDLDIKMRTTTKADYNFVTNTAERGYSAKPTGSRCLDGIFTGFAFCETNGVNGGDPKFRSVTNLIGPDGKIFTLDDGLKPQSGSPLCGKGVGGSDIGAYSCDPSRVFSTGDSGNVGTDAPNTPDPLVLASLKVSKRTPGTGTITATGINCGTDCEESYTSVISVTLTATASPGSYFAGWSGACGSSGMSSTCTLLINDAKSVIASFNLISANTPAPLPIESKFIANERVKVNISSISVRSTANGTISGTQALNTLGSVISGPIIAAGFTWWNINFDSGIDGWVAETYLDKTTGASLPTATPDTTLPSISITSPANNSTISGSTNLTVSASDNIGVVGVRYLVDGVQTGSEVTSSPFSATWSGMSDGTYTLTAEARDAAGNKKLSSGVSVTVKTATVNVAPVLNTIGNKSVAENSTLTFQLSATDGNGDSLAYSASNLPAGATFTGNSFSWKPTFTQSGSYSPSFTVSDGKGLTDSETITITVTNTNRAPVANAGPDQSITLPSSAVLSASGSTDPDGQSLTYSWSKVTGPGSVSFSSNTNISPTASFSLAGTYTLQVSVSDGATSSNDSVTITVLSNPSADDDNDGVLDGVDLCPSSKAGATVNTKGCPVPRISTFTTKPGVTNEDLRAMESVELGNAFGKVSWRKTGTPYSLVKITNSSYEPLDLDTHLKIKAGEISLDSAQVPELNRPATLTFFNVTIKNPEILKNGVICSECDLSYSGTTLTFTVPGFSTYTVVSNDDPSVSITDPSSGTEVSGNTMIKATASDDLGIESVSFYANDELIGTDTSAPYEVSWSPSSGSYTLTAKAKDIGGLEETSSSVSVTGKKKSSGGSSSRNKGVITSNVTTDTSSTLTLPPNATREQLISYLIAKIQELLIEYNRIKALEGGTTTTDTVLKGFQFTKTFGIGTNSSEVRYLQRFLNTHGFPVGTGLGSYGKEVDTFGPVTKATLIKYQLANGIEGTGYFGNLTKQKVNQVLLSE